MTVQGISCPCDNGTPELCWQHGGVPKAPVVETTSATPDRKLGCGKYLERVTAARSHLQRLDIDPDRAFELFGVDMASHNTEVERAVVDARINAGDPSRDVAQDQGCVEMDPGLYDEISTAYFEAKNQGRYHGMRPRDAR